MLIRVFESLGRAIARHPRLTLTAWAMMTLVCALLTLTGFGGQSLVDRFTSSESTVPGSDSARAAELLTSDDSGASLTLVVSNIDPTADGIAEAIEPARTDVLNIDGVDSVIDPYILPGGVTNSAAEPLLAQSDDGFLMVVELTPGLSPSGQDTTLHRAESELAAIPAALRDIAPSVTGIVGGSSLIASTMTDQAQHDFTAGEAIAMPLALVIMVLMFGGFLAAAVPLAGTFASIAGGLGSLWALSHVFTGMDASMAAMVTTIGLGLSMNYGLLIVARFREELIYALGDDEGARNRRRRGDGAVTTALIRTTTTAGRAVALSALTVAVCAAGLLFFRLEILREFGTGVLAMVVFAGATALTLVPALLAFAGRRLAQPSRITRIPLVRTLVNRTAVTPRDAGGFSRLGARVQRHPWWALGSALVILMVFAMPLLHLDSRHSTTQLLPQNSTQREYVQTLSAHYPASTIAAVQVVTQTTLDQAEAVVPLIEDLPGVSSVDAPVAVGRAVLIGVHPEDTDPGSAATQAVVTRIRDLGLNAYVGGQAATQIDYVNALTSGAPLALGIVAVALLVLLFLMTGSVLAPVRVLLTNAVSTCATLGVLVWVFQDGHLADLLGFESTGGIETYVIALVAAAALGIGLDQEVALLARVTELHDEGLTDDEAIRDGLQRSGRATTGAALITLMIVAAPMVGDLLVIKQIGCALAVAVLINATVVRLLLTPAAMTVLHTLNWWAPSQVRRIHQWAAR